MGFSWRKRVLGNINVQILKWLLKKVLFWFPTGRGHWCPAFLSFLHYICAGIMRLCSLCCGGCSTRSLGASKKGNQLMIICFLCLDWNVTTNGIIVYALCSLSCTTCKHSSICPLMVAFITFPINRTLKQALHFWVELLSTGSTGKFISTHIVPVLRGPLYLHVNVHVFSLVWC